MKNLIVICVALWAISCQPNSPELNDAEITADIKENEVSEITTKYQPLNFYSANELDSLQVDLTSYIYRKPSMATWETKLNDEFRPYFIKNATEFDLIYYHTGEDSTHYYYLLRPARDNQGKQKRGVGGMFKRDENHKIIEFEELFNTPILPEEKLKEVGLTLFEEMTTYQNIDRYLKEKNSVEWPDGRLFYSKEKKEWRYVE